MKRAYQFMCTHLCLRRWLYVRMFYEQSTTALALSNTLVYRHSATTFSYIELNHTHQPHAFTKLDRVGKTLKFQIHSSNSLLVLVDLKA